MYIEQYVRQSSITGNMFVVDAYTYTPKTGVVLTGVVRSAVPSESYRKLPEEHYANLRWVQTKWFFHDVKWVLFDEHAMIIEIQKKLEEKNSKYRYLLFLYSVKDIFDLSSYIICVVCVEKNKDKLFTLKEIDGVLKSEESFDDFFLNNKTKKRFSHERIIQKFFFVRNFFSLLFYYDAQEQVQEMYKRTFSMFHDFFKKKKNKKNTFAY